ncbi:MAG: hypothetical protein M3018_02710 [Actinomycetota bacterium]|nr:hypothetical protein [Actinomycetota bacterium]
MRTTATLLAVALALAGCGSSAGSTSSKQSGSSTPTSTATPRPAIAELPAAAHPSLGQFPPAGGRTLQQLGALVKGTLQLGAATGTFTPGVRRIAFGLIRSSGAFVYAPTAVYIATSPGAPARGPFLAPADPLSVAPQYRSQENAGPGEIQAIYAAHIPIPHPGTYAVLSLTRTPGGVLGAPGQIAVAGSSPIPDVGQRPPPIHTDTLASVHGNPALLTTRAPPEQQMQAMSFNQTLGKRPTALLFSTPQLCTSRVCGPVTDVAVELQHELGARIVFIHQEVFVNNQPSRGLRPQLKAFHLQTEPWLFVINRRGVITARLEGAFGVRELRQALQPVL